MKLNSNLNKLLINHTLHMATILILVMGVTLEGCLDNYKIISPKKGLAKNEHELVGLKEEGPTDLNSSSITSHKDLNINDFLARDEPQKITIHLNPATQIPTFSNIPNSTPSISSHQVDYIPSYNKIPSSTIISKPSFDFVKKQTIFQPNIFSEKEKSIQNKQVIDNQQEEANKIELEKKLEGKMFRTRRNDYTVKFYKEKETWWAKVRGISDDKRNNKKLFLRAYLDNTDIETLIKLANFEKKYRISVTGCFT